MKIKRWYLPALAVAALAACGGGGSDSGTTPFGTGAGTTGTSGGTTGSGTSGTTGGGTTATPTSPTTNSGGISTVANGAPSQRFMSISAEKYNLNWALDGETVSVNIQIADTAGNPVAAGSVIQFSTEGGQIQSSCVTTGVTSGTSTISGCSVTFSTQDFRPTDGFVRIIAWMEGEEAYKDLNANGKYDAGEPFIDSGRIFRDDDNSGSYDPTFDELSIGATITGTPGIGTMACAAAPTDININEVPRSVANTCDGVWGRTLIRRSIVFPVSDPRAVALDIVQGGVVAYTAGTPAASPFRPATANGVKLKATGTIANCTVAIVSDTVSSAVTETYHAVRGTGTGCAGNSVLIEAGLPGYPAAAVTYSFPP